MGQGIVQCHPYCFGSAPIHRDIKTTQEFFFEGMLKKMLHKTFVRREHEFFIVFSVKIALISLILSLD